MIAQKPACYVDRMSARQIVASAVVTVCLLLPHGAAAQDPGVTMQEGPAQKEYAIPLEAAERQAAPPAGSSKKPPVAPADATSARPQAAVPSLGGRSESSSSAQNSRERSAPEIAGDSKPGPSAQKPGPSALITERAALARGPGPTGATGRDSDTGLVIGVAVVILLLGATLGVLLRRWGRRPQAASD